MAFQGRGMPLPPAAADAPAATLRVKNFWPESSKWDDRRRRPRSNTLIERHRKISRPAILEIFAAGRGGNALVRLRVAYFVQHLLYRGGSGRVR
jgi:hypothetical protein